MIFFSFCYYPSFIIFRPIRSGVAWQQLLHQKSAGREREEREGRRKEERRGNEKRRGEGNRKRTRGVLVYAGAFRCNTPPWNCHKIIKTGMEGGKRKNRERGQRKKRGEEATKRRENKVAHWICILLK